MVPLNEVMFIYYIFLGLFIGALPGWIFGDSILSVAEALAGENLLLKNKEKNRN